MVHFDLTSEWSFEAPVEVVFAWIAEPRAYDAWWPGFARTRPLPSGAIETRLRSPLGFVLAFEQHDFVDRPPHEHGFHASGDLEGTGRFVLTSRGPRTLVSFRWQVDLTRPLLARLTRVPGARALLRASHHHVMKRGERALRARLTAAPPNRR